MKVFSNLDQEKCWGIWESSESANLRFSPPDSKAKVPSHQQRSGTVVEDIWTIIELNYVEMEIINSKPDASIQQLLVEENYYLFIASYYSSNILFKYPWLLLKTEPSPSYPLLMSGVWASSDYGHNIKMIKSEPSQYSFLRKENWDWGGMSTVRRRSHLSHKPHFFILWPRLRLHQVSSGQWAICHSLSGGASIKRD